MLLSDRLDYEIGTVADVGSRRIRRDFRNGRQSSFSSPVVREPGNPGKTLRQQGERLRSKYFPKVEKKACQPIEFSINGNSWRQTGYAATAKPNQTHGETNDKKRAN